MKIFLFLSIILFGFLAHCQLVKEQYSTPGLSIARESAKIAGYSLSKVQRWLHEVALPKIDPETHLYISHTAGSARYRSLWNYDLNVSGQLFTRGGNESLPLWIFLRSIP